MFSAKVGRGTPFAEEQTTRLAREILTTGLRSAIPITEGKGAVHI
jgi:hypothetical protein